MAPLSFVASCPPTIGQRRSGLPIAARPARVCFEVKASREDEREPDSWAGPSSSVRASMFSDTSPPSARTPTAGAAQEAFRLQQEILERRRNKKAQQQYFDEVKKKRTEIEQNLKAKKLQIRPGEDPLEAWKRLQAEGKIKDLGYEPEDEGGIPIPMASFGIPKYDNGERFDLRLPYVDQGYEDKDADVMGKIAGLFGFGKKGKK
eukprot:tig00001343_g8326.t2